MAWTSGKKADVGHKGLGGVLSTSKDFVWSVEKYGVSPNQLPSDTWLNEVPVVQYGGSGSVTTATHASLIADNNDFVTEYDTTSPVRLVREDSDQGGQTMGHSNTLWMARDALNGNRLRNWINPSNHLDSAGNPSLGYTLKIYKDNGLGSIDTGAEVYLSAASMFFYYKEGALVFDVTDTPNANSWETNTGEQLWAVGYRYTGPTYQPTNNPDTTGQVMSYNTTGNGSLEWTTPTSSGSGSGTLYAELSNPNFIVDCDSEGNIVSGGFTGSGTTLKIYRGTTQLACGYAGVGSNNPGDNDTWAIQSVTAPNVTEDTPTIIVDDETITYSDITGLSGNTGAIVWSIKVKDPTGTDEYTTIGIKQTFSKNIPGADGDDGISPVALMMSNPVHSLATTAGGSVTYTGSGTTINTYIGGVALTYGTADGEWEVVASTTTGTTTPGGITGTGTTATVAQHSAMTTIAASITYTVTVHHAVGGDVDYTLIQSLSKQIAGTDGTDVTVADIEYAFTSASDEIDISILPDTVKNDQITKTTLGISNVEDKSSATIRSEIVDSDIPSTIARDTELPTRASLSIDNVNNTSDTSKPVSTAQQTALDGKQADMSITGFSNSKADIATGNTAMAMSAEAIFDKYGDGGGLPAGSDEEIQYNNNGVMGSTRLIKITDTDEVILGGAAGTNAEFRLNSGSDLILEADVAGGAGGSSIQYLDSSSADRLMLVVHNNNRVTLCNRASNGTVEIRANNSTLGSTGEKVIATFKYDGIVIEDNGETTPSGDTLRNVRGQLNFDGDMIPRVKKVSLSVSEYQNLGTTAIKLLDAPGAYNHIIINNVTVQATSGSTGSETRVENAYVGHISGSTSQYFSLHKDFLRGMPTSNTYVRQFENNNGKISDVSTDDRAIWLYSTGDFVGNISLEVAITYSVIKF
jgi:hypothetical protein